MDRSKDLDLNTTEPHPKGAPNETEEKRRDEQVPNPPHTTTGKITSPKFGSAGSGGAELEPGPERD